MSYLPSDFAWGRSPPLFLSFPLDHAAQLLPLAAVPMGLALTWPLPPARRGSETHLVTSCELPRRCEVPASSCLTSFFQRFRWVRCRIHLSGVEKEMNHDHRPCLRATPMRRSPASGFNRARWPPPGAKWRSPVEANTHAPSRRKAHAKGARGKLRTGFEATSAARGNNLATPRGF